MTSVCMTSLAVVVRAAGRTFGRLRGGGMCEHLEQELHGVGEALLLVGEVRLGDDSTKFALFVDHDDATGTVVDHDPGDLREACLAVDHHGRVRHQFSRFHRLAVRFGFGGVGWRRGASEKDRIADEGQSRCPFDFASVVVKLAVDKLTRTSHRGIAFGKRPGRGIDPGWFDDFDRLLTSSGQAACAGLLGQSRCRVRPLPDVALFQVGR